MQGIAGSSLAPFALVWAALCVLAAALVTDAMLRRTAAADEPEPAADGAVTDG